MARFGRLNLEDDDDEEEDDRKSSMILYNRGERTNTRVNGHHQYDENDDVSPPKYYGGGVHSPLQQRPWSTGIRQRSRYDDDDGCERYGEHHYYNNSRPGSRDVWPGQVYYPPPYPGGEYPQPSTKIAWWQKMLLISVSFWIVKHAHDLSSYTHHLFFFAIEMGGHVLRLARQDVEEVSGRLRQQTHGLWNRVRYHLGHNDDVACVLSVPKDITATLSPHLSPTRRRMSEEDSGRKISVTELLLSDGIVGQARAIATVARAMDGWILDDADGQVRPMALLLTGPDGVGKSETAYLLSRMLFASEACSSSSRSDGPTFHHQHDSVLVLHGEDYAVRLTDDASHDHGMTSKTPQHGLRRRIDSHVKASRSRGAVVILTGTERIDDPSALDALCELLNGDTIADRLLLILTTDLGTDRVVRLLRQHRGRDADLPRMETERAVRDALDDRWEGKIKLGKLVDVIVPFMPLRHDDLVEIMRRKVSTLSEQHAGRNWKRLVATEAVLHHLVGTDYVEYLDVRPNQQSADGDDNDRSLVFSKYGAHTLENGGPMHVVRACLRRYLGDSFRKDEVAFFDYSSGEGVLSWCNDDDEDYDDMKKIEKCVVVWRGKLHK